MCRAKQRIIRLSGVWVLVMLFAGRGLAGSPGVIQVVPIPNFDFETLYKPGSTTITADITKWTTSVGLNVPVSSGGVANYSDGTTGGYVDIPGWVGAGVIESDVVPDTGSYGYAANGGNWAYPNGATITTDAPLGTIVAGQAYTLSVRVGAPNGGGDVARPLVMQLLADGQPLTPITAVRPDLQTAYQTFSQTYEAFALADYVGQSLGIRLGTGDPAYGSQLNFDNVGLAYQPSIAVQVPVPNHDFETLYKPGSTTITADITRWTLGVGPNVEVSGGGVANYSDGTTGTHVDVPGWVGTGTVQGGDVPDTGSYGYAANGEQWTAPNGKTITSAQSLGAIGSGRTYVLSVRVGSPNGEGEIATPLVMDLLADGQVLAPSGSAEPLLVFPNKYLTFSKTYNAADLAAFVGQELTIRLGTGDPAYGTQLDFDNVSLFYIPEPATLTLLILTGAFGRRSRKSTGPSR